MQIPPNGCQRIKVDQKKKTIWKRRPTLFQEIRGLHEAATSMVCTLKLVAQENQFSSILELESVSCPLSCPYLVTATVPAQWIDVVLPVTKAAHIISVVVDSNRRKHDDSHAAQEGQERKQHVRHNLKVRNSQMKEKTSSSQPTNTT